MLPERPANPPAVFAGRSVPHTLVGWCFPQSPARAASRATWGIPEAAFLVGYNIFPGTLHQPGDIVPLMKAIAFTELPICLFLASDSSQTIDMTARRWSQNGLPSSRFCGVKAAVQDWTIANVTVSTLAALHVPKRYAGRQGLDALAQATTQELVAAVLAAPGADGGEIVFIRDSADVPGLASALAQLFQEAPPSAI